MATLLSLNVGMPKDVSWRGRTVHTGVWKSPVDGPRMVRRLNIDGDGQGDLAGHGGEQRAVLVYQVESYRYWEELLGRDDLERGAFGENFTVEGLADDEVCIGDRLRIGEAEFEVTQPRVTCFRVGMRMGEPRLPSLLVAHHRPGFYLRVLTEGHVSAGDEIVRTARGPHAATVAEVDALLYLPGHDCPDGPGRCRPLTCDQCRAMPEDDQSERDFLEALRQNGVPISQHRPLWSKMNTVHRALPDRPSEVDDEVTAGRGRADQNLVPAGVLERRHVVRRLAGQHGRHAGVAHAGAARPPMLGHRIGYSGHAKINRKDFGLTFKPGAGRTVRRQRRDQHHARRRARRTCRTGRRETSAT